MAEVRDWQRNRDLWIRVLEKQTGIGLEDWQHRIRKAPARSLRGFCSWLADQGVTGYAQQLLVMERFGYPDAVLAPAEVLIAAQYADRTQLRPVLDAVLAAARDLGEVIIQARKAYVSLVAPRRTFARVQPTTRERIDLGLRLDGQLPSGRLQLSRIHETMRLQITLTTPADVDAEARQWLRRAYDQSA